jgi:flavin reductase (DIM6/NTAB) family NADH-FMN oxidoreductase RutF
MTIGWGLVGRLWREPVFMVAVRPSRHTFKLIEETDVFTVNVPSDGMDATIDYCGTVSGRDHGEGVNHAGGTAGSVSDARRLYRSFRVQRYW